jgi:hypothetical protein
VAEYRSYETFEDALDHAIRSLRERFGEVDQDAAVSLAGALYACQERDRFERRRGEKEEAAYRV